MLQAPLSAPAVHRPSDRRLRTLLQSLSLYLPVLLMALLALGTWWLARHTPSREGPSQTPPIHKHEPDYYMRNFTVRNFDAQGSQASQLSGRELRHYPDSDTFEIDAAQLRAVREGRVTTGQARRAISNADGSEVQMVGNAVVIREALRDAQGRQWPRIEFHGEYLQVYTRSERVRSHKPVLILREINGRVDRFEADSLSYDNAERVADLIGRTRVTLSPGADPATVTPR